MEYWQRKLIYSKNINLEDYEEEIRTHFDKIWEPLLGSNRTKIIKKEKKNDTHYIVDNKYTYKLGISYNKIIIISESDKRTKYAYLILEPMDSISSNQRSYEYKYNYFTSDSEKKSRYYIKKHETENERDDSKTYTLDELMKEGEKSKKEWEEIYNEWNTFDYFKIDYTEILNKIMTLLVDLNF
ncbi:hypothetical protein CCS79_03020 [Clostridium diolis]|uniref:hypothetical protein n=1 Tax=Clostridium diolis TaxID=223919 RepID=UPI000B3FF185|nr:hypothetical protein [Clostridium diolis]OVE69997.1 hypothetical protein CCS79_03020 [Clostridium diolis]